MYTWATQPVVILYYGEKLAVPPDTVIQNSMYVSSETANMPWQLVVMQMLGGISTTDEQPQNMSERRIKMKAALVAPLNSRQVFELSGKFTLSFDCYRYWERWELEEKEDKGPRTGYHKSTNIL